MDGCSEFRNEFEQACKALKIPLLFLPQKKTLTQRCVERAYGATHYEFYPFYQWASTLAVINRTLAIQFRYNFCTLILKSIACNDH